MKLKGGQAPLLRPHGRTAKSLARWRDDHARRNPYQPDEPNPMPYLEPWEKGAGRAFGVQLHHHGLHKAVPDLPGMVARIIVAEQAGKK